MENRKGWGKKLRDYRNLIGLSQERLVRHLYKELDELEEQEREALVELKIQSPPALQENAAKYISLWEQGKKPLPSSRGEMLFFVWGLRSVIDTDEGDKWMYLGNQGGLMEKESALIFGKADTQFLSKTTEAMPTLQIVESIIATEPEIKDGSDEYTPKLQRIYSYLKNPNRVIVASAVAIAVAVSLYFTSWLINNVYGSKNLNPNSIYFVSPLLSISDTMWENPIDEAVYSNIPAGNFTMGGQGYEHVVDLGEFWLMRSEVTNAQYRLCVKSKVCTAPDNSYWEDETYSEHPVTHVDWNQANTYANWVGGRLPTEAEWEKACRGTDQRIYPWGKQAPNAQLLNYDMLIGGTANIGQYPNNISPYSLYDMVGNVSEWTGSLYQDYPYLPRDGREVLNASGSRVLRGGSYGHDETRVNCVIRFEGTSELKGIYDGFRVARNAPAKWYQGGSNDSRYSILTATKIEIHADTNTGQWDQELSAPLIVYSHFGDFDTWVRIHFPGNTPGGSSAYIGVRAANEHTYWISTGRVFGWDIPDGANIDVLRTKHGTSSVLKREPYHGHEEYTFFRIVRQGDKFSFFHSENGNTWTLFHSVDKFEIPQQTEIFLGIGVWNGDGATSEFSDWQVH